MNKYYDELGIDVKFSVGEIERLKRIKSGPDRGEKVEHHRAKDKLRNSLTDQMVRKLFAVLGGTVNDDDCYRFPHYKVIGTGFGMNQKN